MNDVITRMTLKRRSRVPQKLGAAALALAAVTAIGFAIEDPSVAAFDTAVGSAVRTAQAGWLAQATQVLDAVGSTTGFAVVAVVFIVLLSLLRQFGDALYVFAAAAGAWGLNSLWKMWFMRPRPELEALFAADGFSFPSGNATVGTALFGAAALALITLSGAKPARWVIGAFTALLILAVGWSRLYAGVHYPTDIIGGMLLGGAWLLVLTAIRRF